MWFFTGSGYSAMLGLGIIPTHASWEYGS